jgi:hypothetical protein
VNRRELFGCVAGAAGLALTGCSPAKQISGSIVGASDQIGHLLRDGQIPAPTSEERIPIAIVGGGIAGLSAGWRLLREGMKDFRIFELEAEAGGNSRYGENAVTPYPWGAHYIPMPTKESRWVRILFEELGVIEGYDATGEPIYNEQYLCATPQERLFIHGRWQEGIVPTLAASRAELDEFKRFAEIIDGYKQRGAFRIPMELSSRDPDLLALDRISMAVFLEERGLRSKPLLWYVNYACRDDFGCDLHDVSAWAGIHYFASREGTDDTVLTWPEGNGWIVRRLRERLGQNITTSALAYRMEPRKAGVAIDLYRPAEKRSMRVFAEHVVFACPTFQARFLLPDSDFIRESVREFEYAPWLVANLTLDRFPDERAGVPLAWDNVLYDSDSLGYVVSTHQSLATHQKQTVLTYYHALAGKSPSEDRKRLLQTDWRSWTDSLLTDLSKPHPEIRDITQHVDIMKWGHAMIRPRPGFIFGAARTRMAAPLGRIHFAHSDLSGFSLFEEAQYRGVMAAEKILGSVAV